MLENIRLAFQGVWSHKLRSMLTMLGIIIGIAAIIAIVSTIKGTNEQIKQNLVGAGENTVEISLFVHDVRDGDPQRHQRAGEDRVFVSDADVVRIDVRQIVVVVDT